MKKTGIQMKKSKTGLHDLVDFYDKYCAFELQHNIDLISQCKDVKAK